MKEMAGNYQGSVEDANEQVGNAEVHHRADDANDGKAQEAAAFAADWLL